MKIAVIYKSKYGTTGKYAAWIAEELGADLLEHGEAKPESFSDYDCVVYGGGLYAGGIIGVDLVVKNACPRLVVFTVGLADPETTDYSKILEKNLPAGVRNAVRVFHFRGGTDYARLGLVHKGMMALLKRIVARKPEAELTEEDRAFLETYGGKVDFTDRGSIAPLVEYVGAMR